MVSSPPCPLLWSQRLSSAVLTLPLPPFYSDTFGAHKGNLYSPYLITSTKPFWTHKVKFTSTCNVHGMLFKLSQSHREDWCSAKQPQSAGFPWHPPTPHSGVKLPKVLAADPHLSTSAFLISSKVSPRRDSPAGQRRQSREKGQKRKEESASLALCLAD